MIKCDTCGRQILGDYFSTFTKGIRLNYHPTCKPFFYYYKGDEP